MKKAQDQSQNRSNLQNESGSGAQIEPSNETNDTRTSHSNLRLREVLQGLAKAATSFGHISGYRLEKTSSLLEEIYRELALEKPKDPSLSDIYEMIRENIIKIFRGLAGAAFSGPISERALSKIASLCGSFDFDEGIIAALEESISIYPTPDRRYFDLAWECRMQGEYEKAIQVLNKLVQLPDYKRKALTELSEIYSILKNGDKEIETRKEILRISGDDPKERYNLGRACLRYGDLPSARKEFDILQNMDNGSAGGLTDSLADLICKKVCLKQEEE